MDGSIVEGWEATLYRTYMAIKGSTPDRVGYEPGEIPSLYVDRDGNTHQHLVGNIYRGPSLATEIMAEEFMATEEYLIFADADNSGAVDNEEFLLFAYDRILDRSPDQPGWDWWMEELESGDHTQAVAFSAMTQSDEYVLLTLDTVADFLLV